MIKKGHINSSLKLDSPVGQIKFIGRIRAAVLNEMGINSVEDLLSYIPRTYLDRSTLKPIAFLREDEYATILGRVLWSKFWKGRLSVGLSDDTGRIELCWFRSTDYLLKKFVKGAFFTVSGKVGFFRGVMQMVHPEFEQVGDENNATPPGIMPIYHMTEKLREVKFDSRNMQKAVRNCLERLPDVLLERLPLDILKENKFLGLKEVFTNIHFPNDLTKLNLYLNRLRYEEIFFFLLKMAELKKKSRMSGRAYPPASDLEEEVRRRIPFCLTKAQERVLAEVKNDLASEKIMHRLLQGDVGSGKTVVVALALLSIVSAGAQVAIMAPTEILAIQHYEGLKQILEPSGISVALLTGAVTGRARKNLDESIKNCAVQVVVGTHALISHTTLFFDLGMIVIDEQHRFGVHQRFALKGKGQSPQMLVISATPIPRTLAMTLYGDLDMSVIDEMPPGRIPVKTHLVSEEKRNDMYGFLRKSIASGNQIFVILPLISENENMDELKSATEMESYLRKGPLKSARIGLMHGRLRPDDKEKTIREFREGVFDVLVSTTVVEVGVDIPNANIMVIENAERFGFSQLHQLRGRVGRGGGKAFCFLLPGIDTPQESLGRLKMFSSTNDGFKIAEMDFAIRGPGEMSGL
ncbi:MAG: ATP-dependent DNA helicase RecG, partial [Elusimicrobiota bacterium]